MNLKSKGSRGEIRIRDFCTKKLLANAVVKAGGSLGQFDIISLHNNCVLLIQVKSGRIPTEEYIALQESVSLFKEPLYIVLLITINWGSRDPERAFSIRHLQGFLVNDSLRTPIESNLTINELKEMICQR